MQGWNKESNRWSYKIFCSASTFSWKASLSPHTGGGEFEWGHCAHSLIIRQGSSTQTVSLRKAWDGEKQGSILTFEYTAPRWLRCISKEKFQWPKILAHVHTQQCTINKIINLRYLFFIISSNLLPRCMLFFFSNIGHFLNTLLNLLQYCFCFSFLCFGFGATRHAGS